METRKDFFQESGLFVSALFQILWPLYIYISHTWKQETEPEILFLLY